MVQAPHIGNMINSYVRNNRFSQAAWARRAGVKPKTVAKYLKQPSMRVDTLMAVCQHLEHNFLREIADLLPPDLPPHATVDQTSEVASLKAEIETLKVQVATFERAFKLVAGK